MGLPVQTLLSGHLPLSTSPRGQTEDTGEHLREGVGSGGSQAQGPCSRSARAGRGPQGREGHPASAPPEAQQR